MNIKVLYIKLCKTKYKAVVYHCNLCHKIFHVYTRTQASRCGNTFAFAFANFNLFIISIAVLENVPLDAG
jgi:hypothetical protein